MRLRALEFGFGHGRFVSRYPVCVLVMSRESCSAHDS
jgi:hypothetical protein